MVEFIALILGKRTPDGKECLIIVNHDTGEITLERVNTISNVKNQRGSTGETYDFKTRTRKPLPPKKEIIPKRIEPVVMQSPENKRPPKANRNVPSPVVNKRPKREEERTNEIELPSRIKPYMEQEPSSDMQILGLPSTLTNDPPARPSVPKPAVPTEPPSLFSTSGKFWQFQIVVNYIYIVEESESDSDDSSSDSEDETRSSTDDEKENENPTGHSAGPATTYSAGPATTYSAGPATTYTTTTTTNTTGGFPGSLGLDLSDDSDSSWLITLTEILLYINQKTKHSCQMLF